MSSINEKRVMSLAYLHHWGWMIAFIVGMFIWPQYMWEVLILCSTANLIWSVIGYRCKWRHIFCSTQISSHEELTPHCVFWHNVKKSDIYGVPMSFIVIGSCAIFAEAIGW